MPSNSTIFGVPRSSLFKCCRGWPELPFGGSATEGCIVQTAIDAREQGLKTTILADACASTHPELETTALHYAEQVVGAHISHTQVAQAAYTEVVRE